MSYDDNEGDDQAAYDQQEQSDQAYYDQEDRAPQQRNVEPWDLYAKHGVASNDDDEEDLPDNAAPTQGKMEPWDMYAAAGNQPSGGGKEPWEMYAAAAGPEPEGAVKTALRRAAHDAPSLAASLGPMAVGAGAGAAVGTAILPGVGTAVGGFIGAAGAGMAAGAAASAVQDKLTEGTFLDDSAQRAANAKEHPWADVAGGVIPAAVTFKVGNLMEQVAQRLTMAGGMTGVEFGRQTVSDEHYDPAKLAEAGLTGYAFREGRGAVGRVMGKAEEWGRNTAGRWVPGRDSLPGAGVEPQQFDPQVDKDTAAASENLKTGRTGSAQPPRTDVTGVGNEGSGGVGSERNYVKERQERLDREQSEVEPTPHQAEEGITRLQEGQPDPELARATSEMLNPSDENPYNVGRRAYEDATPQPNYVPEGNEGAIPMPAERRSGEPTPEPAAVPQGNVGQPRQPQEPFVERRAMARNPEDAAIETARAYREAEQGVHDRIRAQQKGEAFKDLDTDLIGPDEQGVGDGSPDQHAERLNGRPDNLFEQPAAETPRKPRVLEDLTVARPAEPIIRSEWRRPKGETVQPEGPRPEVRPDQIGTSAEKVRPIARDQSFDQHAAQNKLVHDAEGRPISKAGSEREQMTQRNSLRAAKETMEKFPIPEELTKGKLSPQQIKALGDHARAALEHAKEIDPRRGGLYAPRQKGDFAHTRAPDEVVWLKAVAEFARPNANGEWKPTKGKIEKFLMAEKLARDPQGADFVRDMRNEANNRGPRKITDPTAPENLRSPVTERGNKKGNVDAALDDGTRSRLQQKLEKYFNDMEAKQFADQDAEQAKNGKGERVPIGDPDHPGMFAIVSRTQKLSEVMKSLEAVGTPFKGKFGPMMKNIVRQLGALEPNVLVHTTTHPEMDRIQRRHLPGVGKMNAFYDGDQHSIFAREGIGPDQLAHEAVHAVTSMRMRADPKFEALVEDVMHGVLQHINPKDLRFKGYEFSNAHEFLAHAMTDAHFQELLAAIPVPPKTAAALGLGGHIRDGFQAFVEAVRRVLGMKPDQFSALEAAIHLTDKASRLELPVNVKNIKAARGEGDSGNIHKAIAQQIKETQDDLLKQVKAPWMKRLRDSSYLAQSSDYLFKGVTNPLRTISEAWNKAGQKAIANARVHEAVQKKGFKLAAEDPENFGKLQYLMSEESRVQRYADRALDKQGFNTKGRGEEWRNARHPELEALYDTLPEKLKQFRAEVYETFDSVHKKLALDTAGARMFETMGIEDMPMVERILTDKWTPADYAALGKNGLERETNFNLIKEGGDLSKLAGPYVPAMRPGQFVVIGKYKVVDEAKANRKIDDKTFEFNNEKDAVDFGVKQFSRPDIQAHYVDTDPASPSYGLRHSQVADKVTDPSKGKPVGDIEPRKAGLDDYNRDIAFSKEDSLNDPNIQQKWWVTVKPEYLSAHETTRDALAAHKELKDSGDFADLDVQTKRYDPQVDATLLARNLTGDIAAKLQKNAKYMDASPDQKKAMEQVLAAHFLDMISATSAHNSRIRRNFVPGANEDLNMNLHTYVKATSHKLASIEYRPTIKKAFEDLDKLKKTDNTLSNARGQMGDEFLRRDELITKGGYDLAAAQMGPGMHRLMAWSYMARLATPGFTIRNLTQPSLVTFPELAGKYGQGAAGRALMQAYKDIGTGKVLKAGAKDTYNAAKGSTERSDMMKDLINRAAKNDGERTLFNEALETGAINPEAGFQIAQYAPRQIRPDYFGARRDSKLTDTLTKGLSYADKALHWAEEVSRAMPTAAEAINRSTSLLAAYRLELAKNGGNEQAARKYAIDVVNNTQFIYSDVNKAPIFRNPWMRPAFQFKQFGKSTYELMGRHIGTAINKEADPEMRKAARRTLGTLFVTHTMVAGALGLPWEPVRALLIGAKAVGITDKEWDDVEDAVRTGFVHVGLSMGMSEKNSKTVSEALARGLPRLANLDMSPGLGADNMLLFSSPKSGTDRQYDTNLAAWLFQMAGGAPVGIAMQAADGLRELSNGEYAKGIEKLMPLKIGADLIKAGVGLNEPKTNRRGTETAPPYTPVEAGIKAMGIPVGREAERNTYQHQVNQQAEEAKQHKSKLIANWLKATGDAKQSAREAAGAAGIPMGDLTKAAERERSAARRMKDGVPTTKLSRPIAEEKSKVYNY